jgi:hypothetical protein
MLVTSLIDHSAEGIQVRIQTLALPGDSLCPDTVRRSAFTARTALYLCSVTLISLMRGSVTNQPK